MNYRSVVVFGQARALEDPAQKTSVLEAFIERVARGRSREARAPNALELRATAVLALPIREASAKRRQGPPK